jgi:carbamoyl-phosphate synthase small subunit
MKAVIALADGTIYEGRGFGATGATGGELVFNTSMSGYQEILTDPSYKGQIVTMTYPLIGNYGVNPEDVESSGPQVQGFVVRENSAIRSNWRATQSLDNYLKDHGIVGVDMVDTRAITKHIRDHGAQNAVISTTRKSHDTLVAMAREWPDMSGLDLVRGVTVDKPTLWSRKGKYRVAVLDCGVKYNILRELEKREAKLKLFPADCDLKDILKFKPHGVMLSNGPGDPDAVPYAVATVRELVERQPMFGICFGHQILGLAMGGNTFKLKFGHRGANHPVKDMRTGKVHITVQNHGFCVDLDSLDNAADIEVTHLNLNDNTVEGIKHKKLPIFSVQFHPEASPGPHDTLYMFDEFMASVAEFAQKNP